MTRQSCEGKTLTSHLGEFQGGIRMGDGEMGILPGE